METVCRDSALEGPTRDVVPAFHVGPSCAQRSGVAARARPGQRPLARGVRRGRARRRRGARALAVSVRDRRGAPRADRARRQDIRGHGSRPRPHRPRRRQGHRARAHRAQRRMMVSDLDEVDYALEVDGEEVRRTLHRKVWERGGWATVAIGCGERGADGWRPAELARMRLQRVRGAWSRRATVTLRGDDALALADALGEWRASLTAET